MLGTMRLRIWPLLFCGWLVINLPTACDNSTPPTAPAALPLASELVLYGFAEDIPQSVLDAFTKEFGVKIHYLPYQSPEESNENIRAGKVYDVAMIENQLIPSLIKDGLLAEIDYANVPNFKNIAANFRDLAIDPGNRYSIPYDYGTTGLLVRTDLVDKTPSRWADLWDPRYAGKIGLRAQPREIIGLTLLSLGYSFNSENPQELDAVLERLLELKPAIVMVDIEASDAAPKLLSGEMTILHGYSEDYQMAHEANPAVAYVLPQEGTALWGDSYVIPANSPRKQTAEVFLNFLLRPEITARAINEKKYAYTNEAALPLIQPEIRNDPVIFPSNQDLQNGHIILPLSPEGEKRYADLWVRFVADGP
ncbi:MAG: spermidine/putrescine ABC transporter substrate-binding protein [Candidatus Competibacter sp.]|nr:spermidine/putrescine ABC transporter substrate-binding protein [Candidatus Contendobacter sp.]MDS4039934.1 spermidine/putrescine ABC transporter substrate-binding protein [Candidatus Competibacter sp.]